MLYQAKQFSRISARDLTLSQKEPATQAIREPMPALIFPLHRDLVIERTVVLLSRSRHEKRSATPRCFPARAPPRRPCDESSAAPRARPENSPRHPARGRQYRLPRRPRRPHHRQARLYPAHQQERPLRALRFQRSPAMRRRGRSARHLRRESHPPRRATSRPPPPSRPLRKLALLWRTEDLPGRLLLLRRVSGI